MKIITILSGKGGVGKSSITASLAIAFSKHKKTESSLYPDKQVYLGDKKIKEPGAKVQRLPECYNYRSCPYICCNGADCLNYEHYGCPISCIN